MCYALAGKAAGKRTGVRARNCLSEITHCFGIRFVSPLFVIVVIVLVDAAAVKMPLVLVRSC